MLPKQQRIQRKDFSLLFEKGKSFRNSLFLLRFLESKSKPQFGFSVSKKVAKRAVDRNKMRRLGYNLLKSYLPKIKKSALVSLSFLKKTDNEREINKEMASILKKAQLI